MQPEKRRFTEAAYLALDEAAPAGVKLEYIDGVVYANGQPVDTLEEAVAMAGATPEHNQLCSNLIRHLGNQLADRGCRVLTSDQKVWVGSRYVYPDITVVCKDPQYQGVMLTNPELIVEVLSPETEDHDKGAKWDLYAAVAGLQEYWMISSTEYRLIQDVRQSETDWMRHIISGREAVLKSVYFKLELSLADVYALVFY